jgi:hypothetical protein
MVPITRATMDRVTSRRAGAALLAVSTAFALLRLLATTVPAMETKEPFAPGEKLTFQLRWAFIPVGTASLEVLPLKTVADTPAYHFLLTARTNDFADAFYKVRSRIESYADREMTRSILYRKQQQEGTRHRDVVVNFDWAEMEARYVDHVKNKHRRADLLPGAFDPLSAFYYVRRQKLTIDSQLQRPVSDGEKCVMGFARVVGRETVRIKAGTFDTFLMEPEMKHIGGVFEKSEGAKIKVWVTADHRLIPVKIASKVVVGSFVAELTSATSVEQ